MDFSDVPRGPQPWVVHIADLGNVGLIDRGGLVGRAAVLASARPLRSLPVLGDVRDLGILGAAGWAEDQTIRISSIGLAVTAMVAEPRRGMIMRQCCARW